MVSGSPARAPAAALALILGLTLACGYSKPAQPGNPISSGGLGGAGPGAGADGAAPLSADAMSTPSHDGAAALSADAPMPAPDVAAAEATPPTRDAGADAAQLSTDAAVDAGATPDGSPDLAADGPASAGSDLAADLGTDVVTNGTLSLDPGEALFNTPVGTPAAPLELVLENDGVASTGTLAIELRGTGAGDFSTASQCPPALEPGDFCTVRVTFAPQAPGAKEATLAVTSAAGAVATAHLGGLAAGGAAALAAAPTAVNLGPSALGIPQTAEVTLTNMGGVAITSIAAQSNDADFMVEADGCLDLPPAEDCIATLSFTASTTGPRTATLTFTGSPGGQASVSVAANGIDAAILGITPPGHDFGGVVPGQTAGPTTFTVENDGSKPTGVLTPSLAGTDPGSFAITGGTCAGQALGVGQSCTVTTTFHPVDASARAASLVMTAPGLAVAANLQGQGTLVRLQISPGRAAYPTTPVNTESGPVEFLLTNVAADASGPLAVSIAATGAVDFATKDDLCSGVSLPAGGSCTLSVIFKPGSAARRTATLTVGGGPLWLAKAGLLGFGQ